MAKVLHTADWQIGRQFESFGPDEAPLLVEARFVAVQRIAQLAARERVDVVLVAGDVFDAQNVSEKTIRRLFQAMSEYAGPWVLLPGNHDAALPESVWTRALRLQAVPANITLALKPEVVLLPTANIAVLPAPLSQRHTHDDLTAWFDSAETPPGMFRIGLAHGAIEGVLWDEIDAANQIRAARAQSARLDYLALGDWHGLKQINERTWYSGTPEQERFRDNGAGQVLLVEITAPGAVPQVQAVPIGQYPWLRMQREITVASDIDKFVAELAALPLQSVLSVTLSGHTDLAGEQKLRAALATAEARHRALRCEWSGLRLLPTAADIAELHVDGYVGNVVQELRDRQERGEDDVAREALVILAGLLREQGAGRAAP